MDARHLRRCLLLDATDASCAPNPRQDLGQDQASGSLGVGWGRHPSKQVSCSKLAGVGGVLRELGESPGEGRQMQHPLEGGRGGAGRAGQGMLHAPRSFLTM